MNQDDFEKQLKFLKFLREKNPIRSNEWEIQIRIADIQRNVGLSYEEAVQNVEILHEYWKYFRPYFAKVRLLKSKIDAIKSELGAEAH